MLKILSCIILPMGLLRCQSWGHKKISVDFFDIKGDVESLLKFYGCFDEYSFIKDTNTYLHSGQSARVLRNGDTVGWLGQIHPLII